MSAENAKARQEMTLRLEKDIREEKMKTFAIALVAMVALLMAGAPAYAQTAIPDQSATSATPMTEKAVDGVIADLDVVNHTLTLQDGEQFTLPPFISESATPQPGEQVEVTYVEEGGQKIVRSIDVGGYGPGNTH